MGEKWEYLKFKTDGYEIEDIEGGDADSRKVLVDKMRFGIEKKLGEQGWRMVGVTVAHYNPFANGYFFFVREMR